MATRAFTLTYIVLAATVGWSAPVRALESLLGVDGCAILASVIYTEVTEARLGYAVVPDDDVFSSGGNEIALCDETARSATSAFAYALRQVNIYVSWGLHTGYSGDYCLSRFLSQCFPTGDPAMPLLSTEERIFVMRSWQAVQDSITARMSLYPGSNVSHFLGDELARSIRRSIAASGIDHQSPMKTR